MYLLFFFSVEKTWVLRLRFSPFFSARTRVWGTPPNSSCSPPHAAVARELRSPARPWRLGAPGRRREARVRGGGSGEVLALPPARVRTAALGLAPEAPDWPPRRAVAAAGGVPGAVGGRYALRLDPL